MGDGTVTGSLSIDISDLRSKMAAAQVAVKLATQEMSTAYRSFGNAASDGNSEAIASLQAFQQKLNDAQAEVKRLAATQREEASVVNSTISTRQAASAELRIFEGNAQSATRAVGALISQNRVLAEVAQAAFIPFAAFAAADILADIEEKFEKLIDDALFFREEWDAAFKAIAKDGDDQVRLWQETARLQHETGMHTNPVGTLAVDAIDAKNAVDSLDTRIVQMQKHLEDLRSRRSQAAADQGALLGGTPYGPALQQSSAGDRPESYDPEVAQVQSQITTLQSQRDKARAELGNVQDKLKQETTEAAKRGSTQAAEAMRKANEAQMQAFEDQHATFQAATARSAGDEYLFWEARLVQTQAGSRNYIAIHQKAAQELQTVLRENALGEKAFARQSQEATLPVDLSSQEQYVRTIHEQSEAVEKWLKTVSEGQVITQQQNDGLAQARIQTGEATGALSKHSAAEAEAALHARVFAEQLERIKQAMQDVQNNPGLTQPEKNGQLQTLQNQATQVKGQAAQQQVIDAGKVLDSSTWKQDLQGMTTDFNSAIDGWLRGTERFGQGITKMADDVAITWANNLLKMGEQWVQMEVKNLAVHTATNTTIAAQDVGAAAQSTALTAQSTIQQMNHYAALAAAKAWSALSSIPIVGPALGAVAAGATYAGVMALAAFDQGTSYIPRDGIAMLHRGEAVLPPPQTDALMDALGSRGRGRSGSGGDNHFHYSPQISAIDGPSVAGALQQHGQAFMREQYRQARLANQVQ
jgi:hypothetical protein